MPRASIIITTHNRPDALSRSVASARLAGKDLEIIVVDDASVDSTRAVCQSMPGIRYIRLDTQHGVAGARAAGIASSTTEFISFLDDDDVRLPGSIDAQIRALHDNTDASLVYGPVHLGLQNLELSGRTVPAHCVEGDIFFEIIGRNFIPTISALFRRSALSAIGGINIGAVPVEDWDLWVRLAERHSVVAAAEPVAVWREPTLWSSQGSSRIAPRIVPQVKRLLDRDWSQLEKSRANPHRYRVARRQCLNSLCDRLLWETVQALRQRDTYAFRSLMAAVLLSPSVLLGKLLRLQYWAKFWSIISERKRSGGPA